MFLSEAKIIIGRYVFLNIRKQSSDISEMSRCCDIFRISICHELEMSVCLKIPLGILNISCYSYSCVFISALTNKPSLIPNVMSTISR